MQYRTNSSEITFDTNLFTYLPIHLFTFIVLTYINPNYC